MTKARVSDDLNDMLHEALEARKTNPWHPKNPATPRFRKLLWVAFEKGWGQRPMADALGMSRQAVYGHICAAPKIDPTDPLWDLVPAAPQRLANGGHSNDPFVPMEPDERDYMYGLAIQARNVTGVTPSNDPDRIASENYTELLVKYLDDGYTVAGLAREIGVSAPSIHNRLKRHGKRGTLPASLKPYGTWHPHRKEVN